MLLFSFFLQCFPNYVVDSCIQGCDQQACFSHLELLIQDRWPPLSRCKKSLAGSAGLARPAHFFTKRVAMGSRVFSNHDTECGQLFFDGFFGRHWVPCDLDSATQESHQVVADEVYFTTGYTKLWVIHSPGGTFDCQGLALAVTTGATWQ